MAMSNAVLEAAMKAALQRLVAALANKDAPNSLKLNGKTLAEITTEILAGKAATAGTADNALALGGKSLATVEADYAAAIAAAIVAAKGELNGVIDALTKADVGLGNVENYGVATEAEALAGAADKYVTAFLADKIAQKKIDDLVGAAPGTLDTIQEIAAALGNDPEIINTLMSEIGTKETPAGAQAKADAALAAANTAADAKIAAAVDPLDDRVTALEAQVGEGSNFLTATSDLGANPVAVASDEVVYVAAEGNAGTATYSVVRNAGELTVQVDPDLNGTFEDPAEPLDSGVLAALDAALTAASAVDGTTYFVTASTDPKTLKQHLESGVAATGAAAAAAQAAQATADGAAAAAAAAAAELPNKLGKTETAADSAKLEGKTLLEVVAMASGDVDLGNVVLKTDDFGQYSVGGQTLTALIAALQAADGNNADSITAVQTALDAFIAAKASTAEAIAGTDDVKYITALGLKASVDGAIAALVDGAPTALDTLKELADALANQNDAVAALTLVIDGKLGKTEQAADSAKLGGKTLATVESERDAAIAAANAPQNTAIAQNTSDIEALALALTDAFDTAADGLENPA